MKFLKTNKKILRHVHGLSGGRIGRRGHSHSLGEHVHLHRVTSHLSRSGITSIVGRATGRLRGAGVLLSGAGNTHVVEQRFFTVFYLQQNHENLNVFKCLCSRI